MESLGDLALKGAQPAEAREFYAAALSLYVRIPASHPMGLLKRKLACLCEDPKDRALATAFATDLRAGDL